MLFKEFHCEAVFLSYNVDIVFLGGKDGTQRYCFYYDFEKRVVIGIGNFGNRSQRSVSETPAAVLTAQGESQMSHDAKPETGPRLRAVSTPWER